MNTYLLFLNGFFETTKDLDAFSKDFTETITSATSIKFIIENKSNVVVVFDSELDDEEVSYEIRDNIKDIHVKFYFLFNRETLMIGNIPKEISDIIFRDLPKDSSLEINLITPEDSEEDIPPVDYSDEVYMNVLLEKIENFGIESLTKNEKKYLDNFKK